MGSTSWSTETLNARRSFKAKKNIPIFTHDSSVRSGKAKGSHVSLDSKKMKGGVRESRDSEKFTNSNAVSIFFDVTGSMQRYPISVQDQLEKMMGLLMRGSYLKDPQVLFGAVGDATCDQSPIQVGQFETGIEMHDDLTNFWLEGGGGGQTIESYELVMYFAARKVVMDCYEKRGDKGFLFIVADEQPYDYVKRVEVKAVFDDDIQANIPIKEIVEELEEKWETYILLPKGVGQHSHHKFIGEKWRELFGQNVIEFDKDSLAETIAATIGHVKGYDVSKDVDDKVVSSVKDLVVSSSKSGQLTSKVEGSLEICETEGVV